MCDSVPSARYSPICNVLRLWRIWLIPTYRVYRLYDYYCRIIKQYFFAMIDIIYTILIIMNGCDKSLLTTSSRYRSFGVTPYPAIHQRLSRVVMTTVY